MRDLIDLIETTLMEAAGTYGFYQPSTDTEIVTPRGSEIDHADYVADHPEEFGIAANDIPARPDTHGFQDPAHMIWMSTILDMTFERGWVRVNQYRGAWSFQARDIKTARATVRKYDDMFHGLHETYIDVGPHSDSPEVSFGLDSYEDIQKFIKTGRLPR